MENAKKTIILSKMAGLSWTSFVAQGRILSFSPRRSIDTPLTESKFCVRSLRLVAAELEKGLQRYSTLRR
jgi:hypothetical protein